MFQTWDVLLWCDPANFGGIKAKADDSNKCKDIQQESDMAETDEGDKRSLLTEGGSQDEDDSPEIQMNWNLAKFLPEEGAIQKNFNTVVAGKIHVEWYSKSPLFETFSQLSFEGYVSAIYHYLEDERARGIPGVTAPRRRKSSQSQSQSQSHHESVEQYARELISGELSQRLFAVTQKIHKKFPPQVTSSALHISRTPRISLSVALSANVDIVRW